MNGTVASQVELKRVAREVLGAALRAGATDAEAVAYEGEEFSALVRLGQVETLKESGSQAIGLRVFRGLRTATTSSSDLSREGLEKLVSGAVELAKITSEDPFAGLPEESEFGKLEGDLALYFEDVNEMPPAERIEIARRCEAAALGFDTRIQNSGGGDFDTGVTHKVLVNSRGFEGEYRRSYCGFSAAPIAVDASGAMQRNYWYSSARTTRLLESPEEIGRIAAERTLRRMGARRVKTQQVPVVFAPEIAKSLMGNLFEAANGDAIYRHATFLDEMLGEKVAGENVTLIDDHTMVHERDGIRFGGFGDDAVRWRGIADAADGAGRERCAEELRDEYLHGAEAGDEIDRKCFARARGHSGNGRGELLSAGWDDDAGGDPRRREAGALCHADDGIWREPGDGRLLAGSGGALDRERRALHFRWRRLPLPGT